MIDLEPYQRHRRVARELLPGLPGPRARWVQEALAVAEEQAQAGDARAGDSAWQALLIASGHSSEPT